MLFVSLFTRDDIYQINLEQLCLADGHFTNWKRRVATIQK